MRRTLPLCALILLAACAPVRPPSPVVQQAPSPVVCRLGETPVTRGDLYAPLDCPAYEKAVVQTAVQGNNPLLFFCYLLDPTCGVDRARDSATPKKGKP